MKNLKKYAGLLNDVAPEGEFLAYINKDESDLLKSKGALGIMTSQGIPSYRGEGGYQGGNNASDNATGGQGGSSGTGTDGQGSTGGGSSNSGGGGGQDMSSVPASTPSVGNQDDNRLDYITGEYLDLTLTPEQKEEYSDYRENVSESIAPSTKTSSKIISGLLSATLFPFAGNLYNSYIDATAMGYSVPNPFAGLFGDNPITPEAIQNFGGDGGNNNFSNNFSNIIKQMTPDSQVNQYFANQPISSLSSGLETSYNNAKSNINNLLGMTPSNQQFGYSQAPYGSYSSTNMAGNPYKDYLTTRGLI